MLTGVADERRRSARELGSSGRYRHARSIATGVGAVAGTTRRPSKRRCAQVADSIAGPARDGPTLTAREQADRQRIPDIVEHLESVRAELRIGRDAFRRDSRAKKVVGYDLMIIGEQALPRNPVRESRDPLDQPCRIPKSADSRVGLLNRAPDGRYRLDTPDPVVCSTARYGKSAVDFPVPRCVTRSGAEPSPTHRSPL
jgi:hypothetical protein